MHDFALPKLAAAFAGRVAAWACCKRKKPGSVRPSAPRAPTRSASRRVQPSHNRCGEPRMLNIGPAPAQPRSLGAPGGMVRREGASEEPDFARILWCVTKERAAQPD